jgi:hypothetical protein
MDVGQSASGASALMVLCTSEPVPTTVQDALRSVDGITSVSSLT